MGEWEWRLTPSVLLAKKRCVWRCLHARGAASDASASVCALWALGGFISIFVLYHSCWTNSPKLQRVLYLATLLLLLCLGFIQSFLLSHFWPQYFKATQRELSLGYCCPFSPHLKGRGAVLITQQPLLHDARNDFPKFLSLNPSLNKASQIMSWT